MKTHKAWKIFLTLVTALCVSVLWMPAAFAWNGDASEEQECAEEQAQEHMDEDGAEGSDEDGDGDAENGNGDWQTDDDTYDETEESVVFMIRGSESIAVRFSEEEGTEYEEVTDGDERVLPRGNSIRVRGIEGYYISIAYGSTEEEALDNPDPEITRSAGDDISIAIDGSGFVAVRLSENLEDLTAGVNTSVTDENTGEMIWSDVSNSDADAGVTQKQFPKVGQVFTGRAVLKSYTLKSHNSIGVMQATNGWLRENTTLKTIAAVCISGPTKAMANVGAVFNYTVKITMADASAGRVYAKITFKPRSNTNNVSYGTVNNYHAATQVLFKSMWISFRPQTGFVKVIKRAAGTESDLIGAAPCNYSLAGAVYRLYVDQECKVPATDINGSEVVLTTDEAGDTEPAEVEPGTYWAREVKASDGFMIDDNVNGGSPVTVTTSDSESDPAVLTSEEMPSHAYPSMMIEKVSSTGTYGWRMMLGAQYRLSYYAVDSDTGDVTGAEPFRSWTFAAVRKQTASGMAFAGIELAADEPVSGDDFFIENGCRTLPLGVFTIEEVRAPEGLARDEHVYFGKIYQPSNGSQARCCFELGGDDMASLKVVSDEEQHPVIVIDKRDAETGANVAQGHGSLAGAEYEVLFDNPRLSEPEHVGVIITDANGRGELRCREDGEPLEVGHYFIREIKASPGYTLDEETHEVMARAYEPDTGTFTYTVESHEQVHHTLIHKTDMTGGIGELEGAVLQIFEGADPSEDAVPLVEWISGNEPHDIIGLADGSYTLREITAPFGYECAEDVVFEVRGDTVTSEVYMDDKPVILETSAMDDETGDNAGVISCTGTETVTDRVRYENLMAGSEYMLTGSLVDKTTGEYLKDSEGDIITAQKTFVPENSSGYTEVEFSFDASLITGGSGIVVFEDLYRDGQLIASHSDPDDEAQSIYYGLIFRTSASGTTMSSKDVRASEDAVIIDTVYYEGLTPGREYRIAGSIYDRTEGSLTEASAETVFTPEESSGTVCVVFRADMSGLTDHSMVVFEELYHGDSLISSHEDPDNKDQTVYVRERAPGPVTGDDGRTALYACALSISAALLAVMWLKKKRPALSHGHR